MPWVTINGAHVFIKDSGPVINHPTLGKGMVVGEQKSAAGKVLLVKMASGKTARLDSRIASKWIERPGTSSRGSSYSRDWAAQLAASSDRGARSGELARVTGEKNAQKQANLIAKGIALKTGGRIDNFAKTGSVYVYTKSGVIRIANHDESLVSRQQKHIRLDQGRLAEQIRRAVT